MSAAIDGPTSGRAARGDAMPAGAMIDAPESPATPGEMPSGAMTGGDGEMPIAGSSAGMGSAAGEMPAGLMTETFSITPGSPGGAGDMPGGDVGASTEPGEMPAGAVGGETDPASGTSEETGGEMPGEGERSGAVAGSPATVEITAGRLRVTISPS